MSIWITSLCRKCFGSLGWYVAVSVVVVSLPVCSHKSKTPPPTVTESLTTVNCFNCTFLGATSKSKDQIRRLIAMTVDSIGVLCNALLIIAILIDPLGSLRKGAWVTILNLAVADLFAATSNFMYVGYHFELNIRNPVVFSSSFFFWMFGASASFMLLTSLTVQTYVIAKYPIRSRLILTSKKIALSCVAIWILAIPLGLSNVAYRFGFTLTQAMKIYITQIAFLELTVLCQVVLKMLIIGEIMKSRRNTELTARHQNSKHKEIAKTIVILNVIQVVTAFPYFLAKQMEYLWRLGVLSEDSWSMIGNYYEPIATLNFAANPLLYSLRLSDYRRSLLALFYRRRNERGLIGLTRSSTTMAITGHTLSVKSVSSFRAASAERNSSKKNPTKLGTVDKV